MHARTGTAAQIIHSLCICIAHLKERANVVSFFAQFQQWHRPSAQRRRRHIVQRWTFYKMDGTRTKEIAYIKFYVVYTQFMVLEAIKLFSFLHLCLLPWLHVEILIWGLSMCIVQCMQCDDMTCLVAWWEVWGSYDAWPWTSVSQHLNGALHSALSYINKLALETLSAIVGHNIYEYNWITRCIDT